MTDLVLYDKSKVDNNNLLFPGNSIWKLLIPIVIEQFLKALMGMVVTMMVSRVGSDAMSAVSLVDSVNILVIQVFTALAAGATIVCSQYLGRKDEKTANEAARQIMFTVFVISTVLTIFCIGFKKPLLKLIFGKVEKSVMTASLTYMWITAASFPFIALFQAGGACFRACGNSRFPMLVSVISNVMNIVGNYILIFMFGMGVAGAAWATLASRVFCMVVVTMGLAREKQSIVVKNYLRIRPDISLIKNILKIGIPSGIENGMFQFGKLAIQSSVSTLGTVAIAAQAMTATLENLTGIAAIGVGIGLMTIVGQCIGAGRVEEAKYYIVKLTIIGEILVAASSFIIFAGTKPIIYLAGMEKAAGDLCFTMMLAITIVKPIVWWLAFVPSYGLRAAGDVKYFMITSCIIMWFARVALAVFLIHFMGFGPMAVWIGMFVDWTIRGLVCLHRYLSGKWLRYKVI